MSTNRRTFLAMAGLSTLTLAGCTSNQGGQATNAGGGLDGKGKTLKVYINSNSAYPTEQKTWFTKVSSDFEKRTGAKVEFETFASANDELQRIQTSVVSNQGPDVYLLGSTFTPLAVSTDAFVPLGDSQWKLLGGKDRFVPASLGISGKTPDNLVAVPLRSRPFVMAYNVEMFEKAGITAPATTWDQFAADAKKLTTGDQYGLAIAYADGFDPWKFIWAMSTQAGNPIVKDGKALLDQPQVLAAYEAYFGWLTKDKVAVPAGIGWSNAQAMAAFAEGKAAMFPMTTGTSLPTLEKSAIKGKWKYALMPVVPPGATTRPEGGLEAASILSGDNVVVAKYSKNQDLAFDLINMLTEKQQQLDYFKIFGDQPTNAEAVAELVKTTPALAPTTDAATKSIGTPFVGSWSEIQIEITNVAKNNLAALAQGPVPAATLTAQLKAAQAKASAALAREAAAKK